MQLNFKRTAPGTEPRVFDVCYSPYTLPMDYFDRTAEANEWGRRIEGVGEVSITRSRLGQSRAPEPRGEEMVVSNGFGEYTAIVVSTTERLGQMCRTAIGKLGRSLSSGRAVKAEAKRFAERVASKRTGVAVEYLDVVGLSKRVDPKSGEIEPLVLCDGKILPVELVHKHLGGDYRIVRSSSLDKVREEVVALCAKDVAEKLFLEEAMMMAIDNADPDGELTGMSCCAEDLTVGLVGDRDGKIARRLPGWITLEKPESRPLAN